MTGVGAGVLVLAIGLFFVWRTFLAPPPAQPSMRTAAKPVHPQPKPSAKATPSTAVAHVPAQAIAKAQAATAAQAAQVQGGTGPAATPGSAGNPTPATATAPSAAAAPTTATITEQLAPGVSATQQLAGAPSASTAFRTYVANLRISGVMDGPSPRALINNRLIHVGDLLDPDQGISFAGTKNGQLVFKDRSGATVTRPY